MIRVLIVDDSAFMRKIISDLLTEQRDFMVLDTARNGKEAVDKVKKLRPDLVTMDVEMPIMNGIEALEAIMKENPTPVVMVSSLTREGAEATIKALELGAFDFVAKTAGPISSIAEIGEEIIAKCRAAAKANVAHLVRRPAGPVQPVAMKQPVPIPGTAVQGAGERIVAIGTSTGGPRALQEVITRLPANFPCGVVIVQHMPPGFTKSLADRLNSISEIKVKEAEHNDVIRPGVALIAPGDKHMLVERDGDRHVVKLNQNPPVGGHRPAVNPMFESVAQTFGRRVVAVILTGMGQDGAVGMKLIKHQQGYNIAEDQSTAVVYGMPKSAVELGVVDKVLPLGAIADEIVKAVMR